VKNKSSFLVLIFLSFAQLSSASDSSLFRMRIDKLHKLNNALETLSLPHLKGVPGDTTLILAYYSDIEKNFFKSPLKPSHFNIRYTIHELHNLIDQSGINRFIYKASVLQSNSLANMKLFARYLSNSVTAYFSIHGHDAEILYFIFEEGTNNLIDLVPAWKLK